MKTFKVHRRKVDIKAITTAPAPKDYDQVLTSPCALEIDGTVELLALPAGEGNAKLLQALRKIKYAKTSRTNGLVTHSRTFGFSPRVAIRSDFCCAAKLTYEEPAINSVLEDWAGYADETLGEFLPGQHRAQSALVAGVLPEWRIRDTVFTSGIVNKDNALGYHRDSGNFKGAWSAMYAFQRDMRGGLLVLPELRVALDFKRPTVLLFDGARLLHGVSPLKQRTKAGYRYSIVYYALAGMANCGTASEEIERIRNVKTEREAARLNRADAEARIKK